MSKIESIEVLIQANADQFRREVADVRGQLTQLQGSATGIGKGVNRDFTGSILKANIATQVLIGAVKTVGRAIFNTGAKVASLGSQYTRLKVATDTVARNMGMTKTEVDDLRASLEDANTYGSQAENVIKTLALSGLVDMANGLKAVDARTGETVEGVKALVLGMKDLGASAGVDSATAIERLTKFVRTGNQSFADGIIELGNMRYAYQRYGDSIGVAGEKLTEQARATARLDLVMAESQKSFGAYANTMQTSAKAMDSTKNAIKSMFERLGSYLEPMFASIARALFLFVDGMRQSLIGSADSFRNWASKVASYIIAVVRIVGTLLSRLPVIGKNFTALRDFALKPVAQTMGEVSGATEGTGDSMDKTAKSTKALKKELLGLASFDELNVLEQSETSDGGGGAGASKGASMGGGMDFKEMMNTEELNNSINDINKRVDEIIKNWTDKWNYAVSIVKPIFESIWKWINEKIWTPLKTFWTETLKPLLDFWWSMVQKEIVPALERLGAMLREVFGIAGTQGDVVKEIFKTIAQIIGVVLVGAVTAVIWIIARVIDVFTGFFAIIKAGIQYSISQWNNLVNKLADVILWGRSLKDNFNQYIESIKGFFNGLLLYIKGVFTGNLEKAWSGVKQMFSSVWSGITAIFKSNINTIIKLINGLIGGLNKIQIPSIFGSKPVGINIAPIPYLAQGGIVESPTLAMLGEAGKEAVLPLDNNTAWITELANKLGRGGENLNLVVKIGEDTIFEKAISYINDKSMRTGATILNI